MAEESVEARCAHLLYHGDDVVGLQWLLQGLSGSDLCEFPSILVPTTDRTFLMACAKQGRAACCKLLLSLDSAASVNLQNAQGYTALHYASYQGHIEVAFLLLAAGADWRILNTHGESAYQTAISGKKFELVNKFQVSPYFADNYYAPANSSVIMSRHDAAQYKLEVVRVDSGGDRSLLGLDFYCLASAQRALNRAPVNDLCGSASEASGSIHYSSEDLYLGRARSNHVCMNDLSLSKQHAVICYIENMGFIVYDIGSKHGTFVNKERLLVGTDVYSKHYTTYTSSSADPSTAVGSSGDVTGTASDLSPATDADVTVASVVSTTAVETALNTTDVTEETSTSHLHTVHATPNTLPTIIQTPAPQPTYLLEGMLVQFGRVHCKVVRKKQEAVLSNSFQPAAQTSANTAEISALHQHHLAVQQRVRALLNVPDHVPVHTTGRTVQSGGGGSGVGSGGSGGKVGQKRKAESTAHSVASTSTANHSTQLALPPTTSQATLSTAAGDLNSDNKGMQLLQKFGWQEGRALGKSAEKANKPISVIGLADRAGLGCSAQGASGGATSTSGTHIIDENLDSEKTKAWKRMMARFAEQR